MKLFYHDCKHETVHDELDLGPLTIREMNLINDVLDFLTAIHVTDGRYVDLVLADKYTNEVDDEGFNRITFE